MTADDPLLLSNQLCFALYSASHAMTRVYRPILESMGITYPQYLVLMLLWESDALSLKALGEQLNLDSGTLTPLVKRMETQGLVRRDRDPADERLLRVYLTDAGRSLRQQAQCIPARIVGACDSEIDQLVSLREQLQQLRQALLNSTRP